MHTLEFGWFLVRNKATQGKRTVTFYGKMQSMYQEFNKSQDIGSGIDEGNIYFFLGDSGVRRGGYYGNFPPISAWIISLSC